MYKKLNNWIKQVQLITQEFQIKLEYNDSYSAYR